MANAAQRSKAQAKVSAKAKGKTNGIPVTRETVGPDTIADAPVATPVVSRKSRANANSIRGLITAMLLAGNPVKEIADAVRAQFPDSQAAAKSSKHIAFYKSGLKKAGKLPVTQATS